jgi:hypothetical protein
MPTTFSNLVPVRRVAVGDCSGPLGSGFDALARSAYTALRAAEWTQSADPPFLPVHDNGQTANKTIPRGDAWKCSYGYDDAARTERSACGAVCYTFALPADAYSGTPANISTVSLSLTGDRYLEAGVDLYLVPSASATPPSVADLLALTPVGTYCATSDQSPTPPNERHGVTEAVEATPGVAAQPYLHVALLLHDYVTNRGAWIEGGAMLDGGVSIAFSRSVAADTPPDARLLMVTADATGNGNLSYIEHAWCEFIVNYFAQYQTQFALSDILNAVRLSYSGTHPQYIAERGFDKTYDSDVGAFRGVFFTFDSSMTYCSYAARSTAYHAPEGLLPGMEIVIPSLLSVGSAGAFHIAFVQHSDVASAGSERAAVSLSALPPFDQAFAGAGEDVIAIASGTVVAGTDQSPAETQDFKIAVLRKPSKPYITPCIVPDALGVMIKLGVESILVASMPTA